MTAQGNNTALWVFAAVGLAGLLICVFLAPETAHRSLEEINDEESDAEHDAASIDAEKKEPVRA